MENETKDTSLFGKDNTILYDLDYQKVEAEEGQNPILATSVANPSQSASLVDVGAETPAVLLTGNTSQGVPLDAPSVAQGATLLGNGTTMAPIGNVPASTLGARLAARMASATNSGGTASHLVIVARAGTGKSTTLIEGLKIVKGIPTKFIPSPQQKAVWEAMAEGKEKVNTICFVAFNKSIAEELKNRVPRGCDASTMHALGNKAVRRAFPQIGNVNAYRVQDIISELLETDIRQLRREEPVLVQATEQLVALCKQNLVGIDKEVSTNELDHLASHYDIELNDSREKVYELVPQVLERCKQVDVDQSMDFNDMIWLPVALNLPVFQNDLLLVDEAQDLNRCQQALARKAGKRLIFCGDDKQAIYGFAGADSESIPRMIQELSATDRGCVVLPLTVTRRCGKAIVKEAQKIVPDFEAFETNPEGEITNARYPLQGKERTKIPWEKTYGAQAKPGDMILCRCNAPLVSNCFQFLKRGIKATIQGRDIGAKLSNLVKKLCGGAGTDLTMISVANFIRKLDDWGYKEQAKEQAKCNPDEAKLIALQDQVSCLYCFTEGQSTANDLVKKIETIFTDDHNVPGIRLSSIHKAKGLEAQTVFFIRTDEAPCPHPMARTSQAREQEMNILYVGITRAISKLVWVS